MDHRPLALRELEADAERLGHEQDVGEQDGGVHAELLDRLQRHLGGALRALAELEEAVTRAQGAVGRQVAPGLTHEPHGRVRRGLAARGAQKRCVFGRHATHTLTRPHGNQGWRTRATAGRMLLSRA
jgi:hypothetical protein